MPLSLAFVGPLALLMQVPRGRGGVGRRFDPRSATRGPVGLSEVCVEAAFKARSNLLGPTFAEEVILGYKRAQGGFERSWSLRRPRQEENDVPNKRLKVPSASPAPPVM